MENYYDRYISRLVDNIVYEHGKAEEYAVVFYAFFVEHNISVEVLDKIYKVMQDRLYVFDADFSKSAKVGAMRAIERIRL